MSRGSEKFRIFISHKHDDHDDAAGLAQALEGLDEQIKCFVSGTNLVAGSDWNAEIRSQLLETDMLLLLFTEPSKNWDWCLYEAGLFTSLGDEHSVVCLYQAGGASPRPLKALQGVPVAQEPVQRFLGQLCTETWRVARKWRFGALRPMVTEERLAEVTQQLLALFPKPRPDSTPLPHLTHYPCHRVVLDLRHEAEVRERIPRNALVVEGEGATSTFTLSLFNLTRGLRRRTWGDLVDATGAADGKWLSDLDDRFAAALREQLFSPAKITPMPLIDAYTGQRRRSYRPVLYGVSSFSVQ
ncbi:MAG: TIR domain-containing protein [Pseudomonadota bacterium]